MSLENVTICYPYPIKNIFIFTHAPWPLVTKKDDKIVPLISKNLIQIVTSPVIVKMFPYSTRKLIIYKKFVKK